MLSISGGSLAKLAAKARMAAALSAAQRRIKAWRWQPLAPPWHGENAYLRQGASSGGWQYQKAKTSKTAALKESIKRRRARKRKR
jgi:hypothetical protein